MTKPQLFLMRHLVIQNVHNTKVYVIYQIGKGEISILYWNSTFNTKDITFFVT